MINKTNILNAISEGIKSGFKFSSNKDNFSSIDFSDSKINNIESFNIGKLEQDFVDLGLSVKWAKCNIGATCQYSVDSWYGDYYTWGEIKTKQIYNEDTYDLTLYKKYNEDAFYILLPEDDIVTWTYYGIDKFRMPTKEEFDELLNEIKIKNEWINDYQGISGLNGRVFTSKITGNSIFIPAAGYLYNSERCSANSHCYLWSSSLYLDNSSKAWYLHFYSNYILTLNYKHYYSLPIRGVCS